MIRAELSGERAPELVVQKTEIEFQAGSYVVRFAGQESDRGTYEFSSHLDDHTMILVSRFGPHAGRTIPCIYELVGDRIRICYGIDGVMPDGFTTANGSRYLGFYRREPAD